MKKYLILTILLLTNLYSQTEHFIEPNYYTKEGYCVVNNDKQRIIGLTRFKTNEQFLKKCKGVMIFLYQYDTCRWFTMKQMTFDIFIEDKNKKIFFKVGELTEVCGKTIIETSTSLQ